MPSKEGRAGADARVGWWVLDRDAEGDLERALDQIVPRWLVERVGFRAIDYRL